MSVKRQINQVTLEEKLRAIEVLWSDLCASGSVPSPQWHKDVLDERQRLIDEGKTEFIDWETAKKELRQRTHDD